MNPGIYLLLHFFLELLSHFWITQNLLDGFLIHPRFVFPVFKRFSQQLIDCLCDCALVSSPAAEPLFYFRTQPIGALFGVHLRD